MQVQIEEVSSFTKKKITLVIESEKELAMLYLRLNCSVSTVLSENGIECDRNKYVVGLADIGMVLFDTVQQYIGLLNREPNVHIAWCRKAIFREE